MFTTGEMMEYDIRTALMIISAITILAILGHGLWKIRKNKNPYKLKTKVSVDDFEPVSGNTNKSGFDQDGIGQVRVVGNNAPADDVTHSFDEYNTAQMHDTESRVSHDSIAQDHLTQERAFDETFQQQDGSAQPLILDTDSLDNTLEPIIDFEKEPLVEQKTVYSTPITSPKPTVKPTHTAKPKRTQQSSKSKNQIEIDFEDAAKADKNGTSAAVNEPKKVEIDPEVIVLSVVVSDEQEISGAALLPTLLTLGMKYGEMNIFHRHQDNAGNGQVTFSLANMLNPGVFDLDTMEMFTTQGVSLFMTLPNPGNAFTVFEQMLATAKHLAEEFNGQVLDDKRSVMTKQTEQHYISKIREFERKYLIAAS